MARWLTTFGGFSVSLNDEAMHILSGKSTFSILKPLKRSWKMTDVVSIPRIKNTFRKWKIRQQNRGNRVHSMDKCTLRSLINVQCSVRLFNFLKNPPCALLSNPKNWLKTEKQTNFITLMLPIQSKNDKCTHIEEHSDLHAYSFCKVCHPVRLLKTVRLLDTLE